MIGCECNSSEAAVEPGVGCCKLTLEYKLSSMGIYAACEYSFISCNASKIARFKSRVSTWSSATY